MGLGECLGLPVSKTLLKRQLVFSFTPVFSLNSRDALLKSIAERCKSQGWVGVTFHVLVSPLWKLSSNDQVWIRFGRHDLGDWKTSSVLLKLHG